MVLSSFRFFLLVSNNQKHKNCALLKFNGGVWIADVNQRN